MEGRIFGSSTPGLIRSKNVNVSHSYHQNDDQMAPDIDTSISMLPTEFRRYLNTSTTLNNTSLYSPAPAPAMHTASIINSDAVISSTERADNLYQHFLDILQATTNDSEVFETIQYLIQACSDTLDDVCKQERLHLSTTDEQFGNFVWLAAERNTWRLLFCLYKDRLITQKETLEYDDLPLVRSERVVIEHLYQHNATLREYQLIVDWLEQCAAEQRDGQQQVGHFTDRTCGWENTLYQLQNVADHRQLFGGKREIVRSVDPDASYREGKPLHDLDVEDDLRLSKQILLEIRRGNLDAAQSLCVHCGQPWRAAILEGWRLHHDPNYEKNDTTEKSAIEGNPRRDLWKKMAWEMANLNSLDEWTRAYVGILSGHLDAVLLPPYKSFLDLLWAYIKIQIDIRVETEIRSYSTKSYLDMPEQYWNKKMAIEQIFEELSAHKSDTIRSQIKQPISIIQKYLILDDIPEMMRQIDEWLRTNRIDAQMLRFLTHLVLFMRQVGRQPQREIADRVILAYVQCLIGMKEPQLVAFYTAALPPTEQTSVYTSFLCAIGTVTRAVRKQALDEATTFGLDAHAIARNTVKRIRSKDSTDSMNNGKELEGTILPLDEEKISSLEWLTFNPQQYGDLIWEANAMIRTFLAENKIECVRSTFHVIPPDCIKSILSIYGTQSNVPYREQCGIKEYLCHQSYLAGIDSYNDWIKHYHMKPKPLPTIPSTANFTERIAAEHKEQVYRSDLERWTIGLKEQSKVTKGLLFNILLFPQKGYLIDPDSTNPPHDIDTDSESIDLDQNGLEAKDESTRNRLTQMDSLRKLCIPEIVLLLHKVLHMSGEYQQCVQLADELASENRQLYTVYTKQKLAEIICKISESSLALMNEKLDPWGYSIAT